MNKHETNRATAGPLDLTVEKLVYGGDGLGRLDGRAVLVPFVLPGESIKAEVAREKPGLIDARLVEVVTAAPERVDPLCPYFTRCGGCHYQHAGYDFQLAQKVAVLREALRRVGKMEAPEEIGVIAGEPWHYRNRAQFHLDGGRIGYLEAGSRRLCPVDQCPISSPRINAALAALNEMAHDRRFPQFMKSIELFSNEDVVQLNVLKTDRPVARQFFDWCAERIPGAADGTLDYPAAGELFRVGNRSFFQVNRFLIDRLVETAIGTAEGETAIELYAGVGLFSVKLARRFKALTAVESGRSAQRDLEFNAARAGVHFELRQETAELYLEGLDHPPDFLLADPPRSGLGKAVVRNLSRLRTPVLTIVSCDPSTLARDLAALIAAGYRIERLDLIDLFPQTYHVETVTRLRLA